MAKIFVADDNPHVHRIVEETLGASGHEVLSVRDGSEVLERISRWRPDLILLDTTLPNADCFDICRGLLAQHRSVGGRIVLLAGPLETLDEDDATQVGVHTIVQKPLDSLVLESLVAGLPTGEESEPESGTDDHEQIIDALVHKALGPTESGPSREAIREQIEAVVFASMPAIIDRIADRLVDRLKNSQ